MNELKKLSIKQWAENDRPRERLMKHGAQTLSDAELLAILIGTGTIDASALDIAREILNSVDNNLITLSKWTIKDLIKIKGIGEAKAIVLLTAMELGRRRREADVSVRRKITSSKDIFEFIQSVLSDKHYEEFWIILLDRGNNIINKVSISEGGSAGTVADPKKIFNIALEQKASSMILCHNHPSGNTTPSKADELLTQKLKQAGMVMDLPILDHLIIGDEKYYSFADEGIL